MSATFDRLFDCGLITIEDNLTLRVSPRIRALKEQSAASLIVHHHGQRIIAPARFYPDPSCLRWHRDNRFHAA